MHILILNGPNLNLLGKRQPQVYGTTTLKDIQQRLKKRFPKSRLTFKQSNSEAEIVSELNKAFEGPFDGVVINAGAYSHYSYAIRDAIAMLKIPVVEVHISNIHAREEFRKHSVLTPVCKGLITGLGVSGYELAVRFLLEQQ